MDAFMCYKQKCKVVSLNLAHPVVRSAYYRLRESSKQMHTDVVYGLYRSLNRCARLGQLQWLYTVTWSAWSYLSPVVWPWWLLLLRLYTDRLTDLPSGQLLSDIQCNQCRSYQRILRQLTCRMRNEYFSRTSVGSTHNGTFPLIS